MPNERPLEGGAAGSGLPRHVACIMDGSGRWATSQGLARGDGHAAGERAAVTCVETAIEIGLPWLTLFVFSTENWHRPHPEVGHLMELMAGVIRRHGRRFHRQDVRIRYLGRADARIPPAVQDELTRTERLTRENTGTTLTFAFDHGGRQEIVQTAQRLVEAGVPARGLTERRFAEHLPYPDLPDVDLLIRTSGEHRLSNFLLWRIAYAEIVFTDVLWPDFGAGDLHAAIAAYRRRRRRYGALPAVATP